MLRTVFSRANAKSMQHCFGTFCFSFTVNWMNFGIFNSSIYSIKFQKGFALSTTFWEHTEPKNAYVINLKILQTNIYRIVVVLLVLKQVRDEQTQLQLQQLIVIYLKIIKNIVCFFNVLRFQTNCVDIYPCGLFTS